MAVYNKQTNNWTLLEGTVCQVGTLADKTAKKQEKYTELLAGINNFIKIQALNKSILYYNIQNLYEQVDGVAMGSPIGPLMASAFLCNIEEQLTTQNKMPAFYKRYVDDTLSKMPDVSSASEFC